MRKKMHIMKYPTQATVISTLVNYLHKNNELKIKNKLQNFNKILLNIGTLHH